METYYAQNESQVIDYIKANYGKFTTEWYKITGNVEERQVNDGFYIRRYAGKCACGECTEISVFKSDDSRIFQGKVCETCYEDESCTL